MNKLVKKYNNTLHRSIGEEPIDVDWSALSEKIETNPKSPRFKVGDRIWITKYNKVLVRFKLKIGQIFFLSGFSFTNTHNSQDSRGRGRSSP